MSEANPWFPGYKSNPHALVRLFCFPYAGGGASIYHTWQRRLQRSVEVRPVQLPGREGRLAEKPFHRLPALVEALSGLLSGYLDKPFALFGHSMGAMVSFELARRLRREYGVQPSCLFVSARSAPQLPPRPTEETYALPEQEFIEELRRLNGTPQAVFEHAELLRMILPLLRADFELSQTYRYEEGPPLDCPIVAFGGLQDQTTREDLSGWSEQTTGPFALRMLLGDHFFLHTSQDLLLQSIARDLAEQAQASF